MSQIESTLTQEEQQTSILDDKYNTAEQNLQDAQNQLQALAASLVRAKNQVAVDKKLVASDAVAAYVYGTPASGFTSYFSSSATMNQARNQYTDQIVGNLTKDETALAELGDEAPERGDAAAVRRRAGADRGRAGQVAGECQRAGGRGDEGHARIRCKGNWPRRSRRPRSRRRSRKRLRRREPRARRSSNRRPPRPQAAATVAGAVGGSSSGAAATNAANQARPRTSGPVGGTGSGNGQQMAAVQAAVSQLGVPYVFGGEQAGVGFDCSGLVQWAWRQAGVSIPRTTETAVAGAHPRLAGRPRAR